MKTFILSVFTICLVIFQGKCQETEKNKTENNTNYNSKSNTNPMLNTNMENSIETPVENRDKESLKSTKKTNEKVAVKKNVNQNESFNSSFNQYRKSASTQSSQRSPSQDQQLQMNEVVSYYEKNQPNSFEYHYFKYVSGNYDVSLVNHLYEAQKLKPKNTDVIVQLAAYEYITSNDVDLKIHLDQLVERLKIESELPVYAQHLLESVDQNGVLITHGFDDTYSALYVQKNKNIRSDVLIISLDFLQSEHYRKTLFGKGFVLPERSVIDVAYLEQFCALNAQKKLQLSLTIPKPYLQALVSKLDVLGLTFTYDQKERNFPEQNQQIWNKISADGKLFNYTLEKSKKLSSNYLPMMLALKSQYALDQNEEKQKQMDENINKLSIQCKQNQKVKSYR